MSSLDDKQTYCTRVKTDRDMTIYPNSDNLLRFPIVLKANTEYIYCRYISSSRVIYGDINEIQEVEVI